MSYLRKHSSIMRTTHATNRRGIVPPSQHGRFFKPTIRKATISGFHGLISEWSGGGGRHCCGIMLPSLPYLPFLYFFFASRSKLHAGRVAAPRHRVRLTPVLLPIQSHRVQLIPFYTIVDVPETWVLQHKFVETWTSCVQKKIGVQKLSDRWR